MVLTSWQFNVYAAHTDGTIQMLSDVWTNLVGKVEATKKHYDDLEAAVMTINDHLNDGLLAPINHINKLEDKFCTIHNCFEDIWVTLDNQQCKIYDMDQRISFYSSSVVQLEGKKAKEVEDKFDVLEQRITDQDNQIKVLLHCLAATKEGCCHCQESTPKVISCHCFALIMKLTEGAQETKDEPEARGLEYEDNEVEAFCHSLVARN